MKSNLRLILLAAAMFLSACGAQNATEIPEAAAPPVIHTSAGDFVYVSARFVDEVHGEKPGLGNNILLVVLARADGGEIDLAAFQEATRGIVYVLGDDGSLTYSPMAGWVDDEFVIGFRPPETAGTFQLIWPENPPIQVDPSE